MFPPLLSAALGLVPRVWPALVGAAGALYFYAQGDPAQAFNVLVTGLGLGHVLHSSTKPAA